MIAAKERGPGPGRYSLPSTVGTSALMITLLTPRLAPLRPRRCVQSGRLLGEESGPALCVRAPCSMTVIAFDVQVLEKARMAWAVTLTQT
jgi:hypothetical protein